MEKTDKERVVELFESLGIEPSVCDGSVSIWGQEGGVRGYSGFSCEFEFNSDGSFKKVGIWE